MWRLLAISCLSLIAVTGIACDSFERVTLENRSDETIDILYSYGSTPDKIGADIHGDGCLPCDVPSGEEGTLLDPPSDPEHGRDNLYLISARETTSNIVIYSRVFTWDELRDMDWRVVITDMRE